MKRVFIVLGLLGSGHAFAAATTAALPPGTYMLTGVALSSSSSVYCLAQKGQTITGTVGFPGAGQQAFEINYSGPPANTLPRGNIINQVRFYAFPTVPASGLEGWNTNHPAGTDVEQYLDGKDVSGPGNTGEIAFDLQPVVASPTASVGGKMMVNIATDRPCQQSYTILLYRVGPYFAVN